MHSIRLSSYISALLLLFATEMSFGQQCEWVTEDKVYPATCFEKINNPISYFHLSFAFTKIDQNKARIIINSHYNQIFDDVIFIMDDNSIIKLIDRNISWSLNGENHKMYYLTYNEISKIKSTNIKAVRFFVPSFGWQEISNKGYTVIENYDMKKFERINFPRIISDFY